MSENINFIPATELPEAEGNEVSVLCVENGELKQKAASGLGGGGGSTNYDLAVRINLRYDAEDDCTLVDYCEILSGSYDTVMQKLDEGIVPNVHVIESGIVCGNSQIKTVYDDSTYWVNEDGREYLHIEGYMRSYYFYPDGTAETN